MDEQNKIIFLVCVTFMFVVGSISYLNYSSTQEKDFNQIKTVITFPDWSGVVTDIGSIPGIEYNEVTR